MKVWRAEETPRCGATESTREEESELVVSPEHVGPVLHGAAKHQGRPVLCLADLSARKTTRV